MTNKDQHRELIDLPKAQRRTLPLEKQLLLASSKALPKASTPREPWYVNPSFGQKAVFVLICVVAGYLFGIAGGEMLSYDDAHAWVNPFSYNGGEIAFIALIFLPVSIGSGLILLSEFADGYRIKAKYKGR